MLKSLTKAHNRFLDDILLDNPGTKQLKKNDFWSKLCKTGPEIVEKKYNVAHSFPDVTPGKNKKVRSVRGTLFEVFRYIIVLLILKRDRDRCIHERPHQNAQRWS